MPPSLYLYFVNYQYVIMSQMLLVYLIGLSYKSSFQKLTTSKKPKRSKCSLSEMPNYFTHLSLMSTKVLNDSTLMRMEVPAGRQMGIDICLLHIRPIIWQLEGRYPMAVLLSIFLTMKLKRQMRQEYYVLLIPLLLSLQQKICRVALSSYS